MVLPQGGRVDSRRFLKAPHIKLCGAFLLVLFSFKHGRSGLKMSISIFDGLKECFLFKRLGSRLSLVCALFHVNCLSVDTYQVRVWLRCVREWNGVPPYFGGTRVECPTRVFRGARPTSNKNNAFAEQGYICIYYKTISFEWCVAYFFTGLTNTGNLWMVVFDWNLLWMKEIWKVNTLKFLFNK